MCTVLRPTGGNPIAVIKYVIISKYNTLLVWWIGRRVYGGHSTELQLHIQTVISCNAEGFPMWAMMVHGWSWCVAPYIFNLGISWKLVISCPVQVTTEERPVYIHWIVAIQLVSNVLQKRQFSQPCWEWNNSSAIQHVAYWLHGQRCLCLNILK
jgi:hypothetical protein